MLGTHFTLAMETYAMKHLAHILCVDVTARGIGTENARIQRGVTQY